MDAYGQKGLSGIRVNTGKSVKSYILYEIYKGLWGEGMESANPEGWDKIRVEYKNVGFFHGYYIRKGYTLKRIPDWIGRVLIHFFEKE